MKRKLPLIISDCFFEHGIEFKDYTCSIEGSILTIKSLILNSPVETPTFDVNLYDRKGNLVISFEGPSIDAPIAEFTYSNYVNFKHKLDKFRVHICEMHPHIETERR